MPSLPSLASRLCVTIALAAAPLAAQQPTPADSAPSRVSATPIFAPLTLGPAPSATRTPRGAPGPKYWQNHADYDIQVSMDTTARILHGTMTLRYTNHSPDTLPVLWFEVGGIRVDSVAELVGGTTVPLTLRNDERATETKLAEVKLAHPLAPGQSTTVRATWRKRIQEELIPLYESVYWYPVICVYDDVTGWSLNGKEGIYGEYGDLTLAITVPAGYIVAATGMLANPQEVLTPAQATRLARAATSPTPIAVVTGDEIRTKTARPTQTGTLTWRFRAKQVTAPAWAASPNYQWDAASWHGILVQSYYRPTAAAIFGNGQAVEHARAAIQDYSERWAPYPYPQYSMTEGPETGTTYAMLSLIGVFGTPKGEYSLIAHELGHTWFPYLAGASEKLHLWMSEGFDTFINTFSEARRYPELNQDVRVRYPSRNHDVKLPGVDSIIFPSPDGRAPKSGPAKMGAARLESDGAIDNIYAQYFKTPYVLQILRSEVIGPAVFDKAFRTYVQRWSFKHPTAMDFFRTMEDVSGHQLSWFWREFFLEAPTFGQGIDSVTQTTRGAETRVTVTYANKGRAVLPLLVRFTFSDGTTQNVKYPADIWRANPAHYTMSYTFRNKTMRQVTLDPDNRLPDPDRSDNTWTAK